MSRDTRVNPCVGNTVVMKNGSSFLTESYNGGDRGLGNFGADIRRQLARLENTHYLIIGYSIEPDLGEHTLPQEGTVGTMISCLPHKRGSYPTNGS